MRHVILHVAAQPMWKIITWQIPTMPKKLGPGGYSCNRLVLIALFSSLFVKFSQTTMQYLSLNDVKVNKDVIDVGKSNRISCNITTGTCDDPDGVVGEWVFVGPNRTFAAPVCCRWEYAQFKENPEQCGTEQANLTLYSGLPIYHQQIGGNGCTCEDDNAHDEYEWQSPTLHPSFDPVETCTTLGNRTALFIGDSTMAQTASTLMNSLLPGKCQAQILFALSDTLVGKSFGVHNRGVAWNSWVKEIEPKPDVVFVAVGAHIKSDDASYLGLVDQVIREMQEMQEQYPNMKFAWKTQQPGGCTKEILSPKNATKAAYTIEYTRDRYNWDTFYQRDLFLIARLQAIGIPYLDMRMLYSRSDSHVGKGDCLHLCVPGPLDVVGRLFHQFLLQIEEI